MAQDEAILDAVSVGIAPPTLRFYSWNPACISLGNAQPVEDLDLDRLRARGWEYVRRLSGGRSILHTDEVTYSISLPATHPMLEGGIVESYRRLSLGLSAGLSFLSLDIHVEKEIDVTPEDRQNPVCFEVPSHYELTVAGKKIVGSAQVRRKAGALQHGTIPCEGDISRICEVLRWESEGARSAARKRVQARAATLKQSGASEFQFEKVARAIENGFSQALNIQFERQTISSEEVQRAEELLATRYRNPRWAGRR